MMREAAQWRCTYAVSIGERRHTVDELQELAGYLSSLRAHCEVLVIDGSPWNLLEDHERVLRWVGHHHRAEPRHRSIDGRVSVIDAALDLASCDSIIVASEEHRISVAAIEAICDLLADHDVVATHEFLNPLSWWGRIDAARALLLRSLSATHDPSSVFGFRRPPLRLLRQYAGNGLWGDGFPFRDFELQGLDVHDANDLFVERRPPGIIRWLSDRPYRAGHEIEAAGRVMLLFALMPVAVLLALLGGPGAAAALGVVMSGMAITLAVHGRARATRHYPPSVCLFAPLAIFERALSIYLSLIRKAIDAVWIRSESAMPPHLIQRSTRRRSAVR